MTEPTISAQARTVQDMLNQANELLMTSQALALHIGLAPFRIAHIQAAMQDNTHAWQELNELATALELTGQPTHMPPCNLSTPHRP